MCLSTSVSSFAVSIVDSNCKNTCHNKLKNNCYLMSGGAVSSNKHIKTYFLCFIKLFSNFRKGNCIERNNGRCVTCDTSEGLKV